MSDARSRGHGSGDRNGRRMAALAAAGVLAASGSSVLSLVTADAYPLHTGTLAASGTPKPGASVVLEGSGFTPGSVVQLVELPGVHDLGNVRANAAGAIAARVTIPSELQAGTKRIEATGSFPGGGEMILSRTFVVTRAESAHVGTLTMRGSATAGARVRISGSGFAPGTKVLVIEFPGARHIAVVHANHAGDISVSFRLPARLAAGPKTIEAIGTFKDGGRLTLSHDFVVQKHHQAISIAAVQDFTAAHSTPTKVVGGGALAVLSGAGLFFVRRKHLI